MLEAVYDVPEISSHHVQKVGAAAPVPLQNAASRLGVGEVIRKPTSLSIQFSHAVLRRIRLARHLAMDKIR